MTPDSILHYRIEKKLGEGGMGLAGAVIQRALDAKRFLALLLQQAWSKDPAGSGDTKAAPRWTAYEAHPYGLRFPNTIPMTTQERAYTSPIWDTP